MKPIAVATLIAGALLLPACGGGGDDDSSGGSGGTLSKDEFVKQGNAACREANQALQKVTRPTSLPGLKTYASEALPIARQLQSKLKALNPPANIKSSYDDALSDLDGGVEQIEALRDAANANDLDEVKAVATKLQQSKFDTKATALGLAQCGSSISAG